MMNMDRISIAFFLYCTTLFAMEHYDLARTSEHEQSRPADVSKNESFKSKLKVPDAIKADLLKQEQIMRSQQHQAPITRPEPIKLNSAQDESINLDKVDTQEETVLNPINLQQQTNSDNSSINKKTDNNSIDLQKESVNTDSLNLQTYGAAESQTLDIGKNKLKKKYKNILQDEFTTSVVDSPVDRHDFSEFLNEQIDHFGHYFLDIKTPSTPQTPSSNLQFEIKALADQVQKYNNITLYSQIDLMVQFIGRMNIFLMQSHLVSLSNTMIENMNKAYATAIATSNILKSQNLVFDLNSVPDSVKQMFATPITTNQSLPAITDSKTMVQIIYDKNGAIENIVTTLQASLDENTRDNGTNQYQIAFLAFALIFQDTIAATISVLNEASMQYKIIKQIEIHPIY